jgi:ATP-binding cassette, subfamily C, type I secretion system permease/ATPase
MRLFFQKLKKEGQMSYISSKPIVVVLLAISAVINILYLTGSFFMLEIYDRVLPSKSIPTLVGLVVIAGVLYFGQALLDLVRSRICVRLGDHVDARLAQRIYGITVRLPLLGKPNGDSSAPIRDLDKVRSFLASGGPLAFFDLLFMPIYLLICFLFHVWIGVACLVGMALLVSLARLAEFRTKKPVQQAFKLAAPRNALVEAGRRNAEALAAMGMDSAVGSRWEKFNQDWLLTNRQANDATKGIAAVTRAIRAAIQSAMLGIGAVLVINGDATAGVIIAASILTARALAPIEMAIGSWKGYNEAQQSWARISRLLELVPEQKQPLRLPEPTSSLSVEAVSGAVPGSEKPVVQDISFALEAGQALAIIGPSASGKSSLARFLVGVWRPQRGKVRLDNAALEQLPPGAHVGYLPQDVGLFAGSIAENISRFGPDADSAQIVQAAKAAGVHEMILRSPNGYETDIGEGGCNLSAGQRQRIGLARALYREPFLVVLDEPNSNLDSEGENTLTQAILGVRNRGGIAVVITHRPSTLAAVTHVLGLQNGRVVGFKARQPEEVSKVANVQ